jgi:hypothetical protein
MGVSTAGDGIRAMDRAHGLRGDEMLGERVEVPPCRTRPIDAAALQGLYTSASHTAAGEADPASLAAGPTVVT